MNKDITLVILAAGMGSRFGGLKQIAPMGPNDEFLIDYSIYDAIKAGFNKVVFLIKEENFDIFKETIGSRVEPHIKVEYAFQKNDNLPDGYDEIKDRVKPLGTAHAILCCKDKVNEPFMMINADDFYGRDAYKKAAEFLNSEHSSREFALIGYKVCNTLTVNGSVKRGVCQAKDGYLTSITESTVEEKDGTITCTPLDGSEPFNVISNSLVSMNMFCFTKDLFPYLDEKFVDFFEKNKHDLSKCEYLIPDSVYNMVKEGLVKVRVIPTTAKWQGITYKEDKERLVNDIKSLIDKGEYPVKLWK